MEVNNKSNIIQLDSIDRLKERSIFLDKGLEGEIYIYNPRNCIKLFTEYSGIALKRKIEKVKILSRYSDKSFAFPIGIVNINDYEIGYYMQFIKSYFFEDFDGILLPTNLSDLHHIYQDKLDIINFLLLTNDAIERAHHVGIAIGDIHGGNILINKDGLPVFIDTDNYAIDGYDFDLDSVLTSLLRRNYHRKFSNYDNDNFVFTLLALNTLYPDLFFLNENWLISDDKIQEDILKTDLPIDLQEGIRDILSDSENKPSIGPILQRIKGK